MLYTARDEAAMGVTSESLESWLLGHGLSISPVLDGKIRRFSVDGDSNKSGWYIGSQELGVTTLTVGDWRTDEKLFFKTGGVSEKDEKRFQEAIRAKAKLIETERRGAQEDAAREARKIYEEAREHDENHPYLVKKGIQGKWQGVKQQGQALIVPMQDAEGNIVGLQRIYPDGTKRFLKGQRKSGCYYRFFNGDDANGGTCYIVEGFATGASIHKAIGASSVYVCFDAGNLRPVAETLPGRRMVYCGDDDKYSDTKNTGRIAAESAAKSTGGIAVFPIFKESGWQIPGVDIAKLSDFNDLMLLAGTDEVKRQIEAVTRAGVAMAESSTGGEGEADRCDGDGTEAAGYDVAQAEEEDEISDVYNKDAIKFLGFIEGKHCYISNKSGKMVALSAGQHVKLHLLELMPLSYWDQKYPLHKKVIKNGLTFNIQVGIEWDKAADELISNSLKSGYFEPGRIRGSGVYKEGKKVVINNGKKVLSGGESYSHADYKSEYIYIPGPKIDYDAIKPCTMDDCLQLLDAANMLLWQRKEEAIFFTGWLTCAVLSGALKWRPHLYITGVPGAGKSWVLENIVHPMISQFSEYYLSSTTEAGIRQSIKNNALAVIWDEPEVNNEADNRSIQKVLTIARQSSFESDGRISKGTASGSAMEFSMKSCFLLGSVKDAVQEGADLTRFTILNLTKISNPIEARAHFEKLEKTVFQLVDGDFPKRFCRMVIDRIEDFESNNEIFKKIISVKYNARVAQQYAALLAGYMLIESSGVVSKERAMELCEALDSQDNTHHDSNDDIAECFNYLTSKVVVVDAADDKSGTVRMSIAEILEKPLLWDRLISFGMKATSKDGKKTLFISYSNPQLKDIFRDTKWISGWGRSLAKMPGARRATQRLSGIVRMGVEIELSDYESGNGSTSFI